MMSSGINYYLNLDQVLSIQEYESYESNCACLVWLQLYPQCTVFLVFLRYALGLKLFLTDLLVRILTMQQLIIVLWTLILHEFIFIYAT